MTTVHVSSPVVYRPCERCGERTTILRDDAGRPCCYDCAWAKDAAPNERD